MPIEVNIGSGNGLLPNGTKPLPEPMLTYHQQDPLTSIWGLSDTRHPSHQSLILPWKLQKYLNFQSNHPGANELKKHFSLSGGISRPTTVGWSPIIVREVPKTVKSSYSFSGRWACPYFPLLNLPFGRYRYLLRLKTLARLEQMYPG